MIVIGTNGIAEGLFRNFELVRRHIMFFARHHTTRKFINLCSLYLQRYTKRHVLSAKPIEVIIEPTNICQLRCPLCPTGQRTNLRPAGMMKWETFQKIIDELAPWLYKVRLYNWGEPLIHPDIFRMIRYAQSKNISTELSSHLNTLGQSGSKELIESGLELLILSLNGIDSETYSKYHISGVLEKACSNIKSVIEARKKLNAKYPIVEIQFLIMRHNEEQLSEMIRLADSLGVDRLRFGPVTINVKNQSDWQWLPKNEKFSRYLYHQKKDKIYSYRKQCEWLWRSAVFNWDGTVSPCCVYEGPRSVIGSIIEQPFLKIWNNEKYVDSRRIFKHSDNRIQKAQSNCIKCQGMPFAADENQHGLY